jgi:regulator of protease activity HflC (stomatin/prohibitin superfamily)
MLTPTTVFVLIGLAMMLAGLACVRRIPEGQAYTLRRVGGHLRTIGAGTHLVVPGVERVAHRIRLLGNVVGFTRLQVGARRYEGQVYYQVLDAERADAVIDNIDNLVCGCLRGLLDAASDEDAAARNGRVKAGLNGELREQGILVTRVQIAAA